MHRPRLLLLRLRRRIRRAIASPPMNSADRATLRAIEEFTGHRRPQPPHRSMKNAFLALLLLVVALFILGLTSCATVTTKTTTTDPATGLVTVTETTTTAPDSASVNALAGTAAAFAPRGVVIEIEPDK